MSQKFVITRMFKNLNMWVGVCLPLFLLSSNLFGASNIPPGAIEQVDPGRTGEQLTPTSEPPELMTPDMLRLPSDKEPLKQQQGPETSFILGGINLSGNTVFKNIQLAKFYEPYIGQEVTHREIKNICREITKYYRNAGYILSKAIIPTQEVEADGIVKIQVLEGYIDNVTIEGQLRDASRKLITAYAKHIAAQKPLTLAVLERYTLLANDIPDAKVRTIIRPSATTAGAAELVMITEQQLNNWYIGANNFNSELLGREQMLAGINANGYFSGSQTSIRGVMSFNVNRMKYIALLHKQQINTNGLGFDFNVSDTNTAPNFESIEINNLQTPGQAFIFNINTTYQCIRSRKKNLSLAAGFNYLNSHTNYANTELFNDATRAINAKITYNFFGLNSSFNTLEAAIYQGLNILDAHAAPPSVLGGKTNFTKVTGSASSYQPLVFKNTYLLLWAKGQFGITQLLSSEKFGFGGSPFGYGYDPSVITGDRGYALKIEPQYNYQLGKKYLPNLQFFGFFDTASVWNINKNVQPGHQSATSIGAGMRSVAYKRISIELIVAQPFNVFVTNNNKNHTRLMFNIFYTGGTIFG